MRGLKRFMGWRLPRVGAAATSADELAAALLAINRDTAPFRIRGERPGEPHISAEWRIAEPRWHAIFANAGVVRTSRILLRLHGERHRVDAAEQAWSVEWRGGAPVLGPGGENFPRRRIAVQFGTDYAFTEHLSYGEDRHYRFSTKELRAPLQAVVATCGWLWRTVPVEALGATYALAAWMGAGEAVLGVW